MQKYVLLLLVVIIQFSFKPVKEDSNWTDGIAFFEIQQIFENERFPNVVVAKNGNIIASWGRENFRVRYSEDGGKTWSQEKIIQKPGFHGGGMLVNECDGGILVFVDLEHPKRIPKSRMGPVRTYRSDDHGKTWTEMDLEIFPDVLGNVPDLHMCERGITLIHGEKRGRLNRPARVYYGDMGAHKAAYNTAIYSDDNGKTWYPSTPFPALGTGEGAIEELSNGILYYNSRRHWAPKGEDSRRRWEAWSYDSGETWANLKMIEELPDGSQHRDYGLMGGLVRLPIDGHEILLFSNIESIEGRHHGTVWASFDGGKTWPAKRLVEEGSFAYSSMAAGRKGTPSEGKIYLFYESDGGAKMAIFNLDWITKGQDWEKYLIK